MKAYRPATVPSGHSATPTARGTGRAAPAPRSAAHRPADRSRPRSRPPPRTPRRRRWPPPAPPARPRVRRSTCLLHQLPQRRRRPRRDVLGRAREPPLSVDVLELPLADQVVDRVHQKQRIAVRVPVEHAGQLRPATRARESAGRDIRPRRPRSGTRAGSPHSIRAAAAPAGPVSMDARSAATSAGRYVPRTSRRAASRRRASMPSRSMVAESLQCRSSSSSTSGASRVRVVQRLHQLAQHPVARGPLRPALHRLHVAVAQQPRQLLQPGRRMLLEHLDQLFAAGRSPQSSQRFQHRQIRFPGAVLLHALPAADAQRLRSADLGQERLDQRGLADPRLPGHEHELPLAARAPLASRACRRASSASRPTRVERSRRLEAAAVGAQARARPASAAAEASPSAISPGR